MGGFKAVLVALLVVGSAGIASAEDDLGPLVTSADRRFLVVPSPCPGPNCRPPDGVLEPAALGPRRVFVNFDPVTLTRTTGWEDARDNTSNILVSSSRTIPGLSPSDLTDGYGYSQSQIENAIIERMYALYTPYEVELVTARPSSGNYHMIVFGSTCQTVAGESCAGISLADCGDTMANNVSFVFPGGLSIEEAATTAAHEVGHAFGLNHTNDTYDVMYPSIQPYPPPSFGAGNIPDDFLCNDSTYQDSHQLLLDTIGERGGDYVAPTIAIQSPADGATVTPGDTVRIASSDNVGITKVEVYFAGQLEATRTIANFELAIPSSVPSGNLTILAKAFDGSDNTGTDRIVVQVDRGEPECTGDDDCPEGEHCDAQYCVPDDDGGGGGSGALGDICTGNESCTSGLCAQVGDESRCTQQCSDDSGCPDDFECVGGVACWPADPEQTESSGGCAVSSNGAATPWLLLAFALWIARRRRR